MLNKRVLLVILLLVVAAPLTVHIWVRSSVLSHIEMAKKEYGGSAEDALISLMLDETKPPLYRTHNAVWTLGQIQSKRSLPELYKLYLFEYEPGVSCRNHHDKLICQYELDKAINAIENGRLISFAGLNK